MFGGDWPQEFRQWIMLFALFIQKSGIPFHAMSAFRVQTQAVTQCHHVF
jgi:hypothetical protein